MQEETIKEKYGKAPGFRVPEGYFENLQETVMASLPEYPSNPDVEPMTRWQRLKPYVYLAAMFAGIWMMMNLFHRVSGYGTLNLDNPPEEVALAMASVDYGTDIYRTPVSDYELVDEVSAEFDNISEFETEFGYELKPEYVNL